MTSVKKLSDQELDEQIRNCQEQMDVSEYGTGDYNCAAAELRVAETEKKRRDKIWGYQKRNQRNWRRE